MATHLLYQGPAWYTCPHCGAEPKKPCQNFIDGIGAHNVQNHNSRVKLAKKTHKAKIAAHEAAQVKEDSLEDFKADQWWVKELDTMTQLPGVTDDQKRAVAVVHHLLRVVAQHVESTDE